MQVAITELFKRLPGLALAGEAVVDNDNLTLPIVDLPVTW